MGLKLVGIIPTDDLDDDAPLLDIWGHVVGLAALKGVEPHGTLTGAMGHDMLRDYTAVRWTLDLNEEQTARKAACPMCDGVAWVNGRTCTKCDGDAYVDAVELQSNY